MTQADWRSTRRFPPADRYPHGTRSRYVSGCRCAECRHSNVRLYHRRQAMAKEAALAHAAVSTPGAATPIEQAWTAPDGSKRLRRYKRACPGVAGYPCPLRAHLRTDSVGGICSECRSRLVWNGLVDAARARRHLQRLSVQGVGYKSVGDASGVARSILAGILSGRRRFLRRASERRILAVDRSACSDKALVPAGATWRRVEWLLAEGFTKAEIARRLGYKAPALQFNRRRITAATALKVERLYNRFQQ